MNQESTSVCGYLENNGTITKIASIEDVEKWLGNIRNGDENMITRINLMDRTAQKQHESKSSWNDPNGAEYVPLGSSGCFLKKGVYGRRAYKTSDYTKYIGDRAFANSTELETLYVSDKVTAIGENTFMNCYNLTEVRLPLSLKLINTGCFSNCTALREIVIPEGTLFIEKEAFSNCDLLNKITLPGSLMGIGDDVFWACKELQDIYVPNYAFDKIAQMLPEKLHEKLRGI